MSAPLTVERIHDLFEHPAPLTVGAEEELMLLDPATFALSPSSPELLARLDGDERFKHEALVAQVEIATPVCTSAAEVGVELQRARALLAERAGGLARLAGAGTHPAGPAYAEMSPGERYEISLAEYGWAARRGILAAGMHVHVCVRGARRALAVYNALRGHMPELLALFANAPFVDGVDTGFQSIRPKLADAFPRQGVGPVFRSFEEYVEIACALVTHGSAVDLDQLWWECRVHPRHGTLEIRVPDQQTSVEDAEAVAAVAHALCAWLAARHDAGELLPAHRTVLVQENRWRALRYGVHGSLIDLESGRPVPTGARLSALLDALEPHAAALGGERGIARARRLLERSGADRQRAVAAERGLAGLCAWLCDETERVPARV